MDPAQEMRQLEKGMAELRRLAAERAGGTGPRTTVVRRRRPKMIAVFSYKGGVTKSTTVINLPATLAKMGRKTLAERCG